MREIVARQSLESALGSLLLLLAMGAVLAGVGWLLGGGTGVLLSLGFALLFAVLGPGVSPARLMRAQGARRLHPAEVPGLLEAVAELGRQAGLPRPPVLYLLPLAEPQAMAMEDVGPAVIGVSPSLLRALRPREVLAVIAHEISHLARGDLWVLRLATTIGGLTRTMSSLGVFLLVVNLPLMLVSGGHVPWLGVLALVLAPRIVGLLALAISRERELGADAGAVELTGDPLALASALSVIERAQRMNPWQRLLAAEVPEWLRTHPSTELRVARLEEMAGRAAPPGPRLLPLP